LEMPIRCELFDTSLQNLLEQIEKSGISNVWMKIFMFRYTEQKLYKFISFFKSIYRRQFHYLQQKSIYKELCDLFIVFFCIFNKPIYSIEVFAYHLFLS
jgi:hypothetical protein